MVDVTTPNRTAQSGRTLIELMVAITLSIMILLGVGTLYLGSNQATRASNSTATVEETAQILLTVMGRSIRRAGYAEIVGTQIGSRDNYLYNGPHLRGCTNGRFVDPAANDFSCTADATRMGDTLAVWYQADGALASSQGPTRDCVGDTAPFVPVDPSISAGAVTDIPLVRNIYYLDTAGNFSCEGNGAGGPQVLANNVEDFRVYYGFDDLAHSDPNGVTERPSARSILTAAQVDAMGDAGTLSPWEFVVSTHVCILVRTQEIGVSAQDGTAQYRPCPATTTQAVNGTPTVTVPGDGAVRRAYVEVFTVRSRSTANPSVPI